MKCEYEYKICLYLDGEISESEKLEIQNHLKICKICQSYYNDTLKEENRIKNIIKKHVAYCEFPNRILNLIQNENIKTSFIEVSKDNIFTRFINFVHDWKKQFAYTLTVIIFVSFTIIYFLLSKNISNLYIFNKKEDHKIRKTFVAIPTSKASLNETLISENKLYELEFNTIYNIAGKVNLYHDNQDFIYLDGNIKLEIKLPNIITLHEGECVIENKTNEDILVYISKDNSSLKINKFQKIKVLINNEGVKVDKQTKSSNLINENLSTNNNELINNNPLSSENNNKFSINNTILQNNEKIKNNTSGEFYNNINKSLNIDHIRSENLHNYHSHISTSSFIIVPAQDEIASDSSISTLSSLIATNQQEISTFCPNILINQNNTIINNSDNYYNEDLNEEIKKIQSPFEDDILHSK